MYFSADADPSTLVGPLNVVPPGRASLGTRGPLPLTEAAALADTLAALHGDRPPPTNTEPIQPDSPSNNTRRITSATADALVARLTLSGTLWIYSRYV
jgi:hypothetical protein